MLAALGTGETRVSPLSDGADNRSTLRALQALGVRIDLEDNGRAARIHGVGGPSGLRPSEGPVDCGNSGTTMRLLTGLLAATDFCTTLTGDASLCARPMSRLLPLCHMGAKIDGAKRADGRILPPLTVRGAPLIGKEHRLAIASAQVKSALLLAGLWARGDTAVHEPARSRDHTERMLRRLGVPVRESSDGTLWVSPIEKPWRQEAIEVAPDFSSAAFLLGASLVADSPDLVAQAGVNPTRTGFLTALETMGVSVKKRALPEAGGEPVAELRVLGKRADLRGATIEGKTTVEAIDEIPLLAGLAAFARGRTVIKDAQDLRKKESDRLAAMQRVLEAFGAKSQETPGGLIIDGGSLRPAEVDSFGDHRIAMTAVVMGLGIEGETVVHGAECIAVSYPAFTAEMLRLGARLCVEDGKEHAPS